jgi:hypothetical protein
MAECMSKTVNLLGIHPSAIFDFTDQALDTRADLAHYIAQASRHWTERRDYLARVTTPSSLLVEKETLVAYYFFPYDAKR